ncbi:oligosaccharide flippase family protein [Hespellia stercorisuis]|uniref:Stage V sporulation protein B n=1 Tax=Hespellia stercorisuis DSM 15480 TaxID=1121950 RepID=A0A1M6NR73_9FIRM|nr:oligosaccharide flippase family protein [Hespellia stercorisuis]SHJ98227.1 stage V sporulation protein B [Hespellia stercorisuis DSM 15480]
MNQKSAFFKGTLLLTFVNFATRFMGFFYRIFLSRVFGEEMIGLYQLTFPVFVLGISFSSAGIQTALSQLVAYKTSTGRKKDSVEITLCGLFISLLLSLLALFLIKTNAAFLSTRFLGDPRCQDLLILLAYAIPFSAVHSCICGYAFGLKQTRFPAFSQLLEQIMRIVSVLFIYLLATAEGIRLNISVAVFGIILGEMVASASAIAYLKKDWGILSSSAFSFSIVKSRTSELLQIASPLTANRVLLNVLQSIEAFSIPLQLRAAGCDAAQALSIYGVLTGMALPCVLFPSAVTNAVSLLMTPTVAEMSVEPVQKKQQNFVKKILFCCFGLGVLCGLLFLIFGKFLGTLLFHSALAGDFILTLAWICPFLYLNTTLISVINGFGKTTLTFLINMAGIIIRIISIFLLIPICGIHGYLIGLLISQFVICMLSATVTKRIMS